MTAIPAPNPPPLHPTATNLDPNIPAPLFPALPPNIAAPDPNDIMVGDRVPNIPPNQVNQVNSLNPSIPSGLPASAPSTDDFDRELNLQSQNAVKSNLQSQNPKPLRLQSLNRISPCSATTENENRTVSAQTLVAKQENHIDSITNTLNTTTVVSQVATQVTPQVVPQVAPHVAPPLPPMPEPSVSTPAASTGSTPVINDESVGRSHEEHCIHPDCPDTTDSRPPSQSISPDISSASPSPNMIDVPHAPTRSVTRRKKKRKKSKKRCTALDYLSDSPRKKRGRKVKDKKDLPPIQKQPFFLVFPDLRLKCPQCDHIAICQGTLVQHLRTHPESRKCPVCSKLVELLSVSLYSLVI